MCGGFVGFGLGVLVRALFESGFDGSQVLDGSTWIFHFNWKWNVDIDARSNTGALSQDGRTKTQRQVVSSEVWYGQDEW